MVTLFPNSVYIFSRSKNKQQILLYFSKSSVRNIPKCLCHFDFGFVPQAYAVFQNVIVILISPVHRATPPPLLHLCLVILMYSVQHSTRLVKSFHTKTEKSPVEKTKQASVRGKWYIATGECAD